MAVGRMRSASLLRVPNALRGLESTAGRQGRRHFLRSLKSTTSCHSSGGSTWLASLSLLARSDFAIGTLRRSASRMRPTAVIDVDLQPLAHLPYASGSARNASLAASAAIFRSTN